MKKITKILSLLLVLTMLVGVAQVGASAQSVDVPQLNELRQDKELKLDLREYFGISDKYGVKSAEDSEDSEDSEDEMEIKSEGGWTFAAEGKYAYLIEYTEPINGTLKLPGTVGGYTVVGWDYLNDFFLYELSKIDYELYLPDNFPQSLVDMVYEMDEIPEGITEEDIFWDMFSIVRDTLVYVAPTSFNISNKNKFLTDVDGVLYSKDKTVLIRYPIGRETDSFYLPKKAKTYFISETLDDCFATGPFAPVFGLYGEILRKAENLTVHVHDEQMQAYFDWYTSRNPEDYAGFALNSLTEFYVGTKTICTEWNSEMLKHFTSAKEFLAFWVGEEYVATLFPDVLSCNGPDLSYFVWWEWILYVFFFGWIWY